MSWSRQSKLIAGDGAAGDLFGNSVSVDGETVVVGARQDDTAAGTSAGSAYVFVRSGMSWSQQAQLTASDGAALGFFGRSVSVDGDTVVVGADMPGAGAAYVFALSGTSWVQQAKLTASDRQKVGGFGRSVSLDGDTVVVGAPGTDPAAATGAGAAYVFVRSGRTSWSQHVKLTAGDGAFNDGFGCSVSVDGDTVVVGAHQNDTVGNRAGAAYVFVRSEVLPIGFSRPN